jgi:hypothetical protein
MLGAGLRLTLLSGLRLLPSSSLARHNQCWCVVDGVRSTAALAEIWIAEAVARLKRHVDSQSVALTNAVDPCPHHGGGSAMLDVGWVLADPSGPSRSRRSDLIVLGSLLLAGLLLASAGMEAGWSRWDVLRPREILLV